MRRTERIARRNHWRQPQPQPWPHLPAAGVGQGVGQEVRMQRPRPFSGSLFVTWRHVAVAAFLPRGHRAKGLGHAWRSTGPLARAPHSDCVPRSSISSRAAQAIPNATARATPLARQHEFPHPAGHRPVPRPIVGDGDAQAAPIRHRMPAVGCGGGPCRPGFTVGTGGCRRSRHRSKNKAAHHDG
jgi:hypothetical protein